MEKTIDYDFNKHFFSGIKMTKQKLVAEIKFYTLQCIREQQLE